MLILHVRWRWDESGGNFSSQQSALNHKGHEGGTRLQVIGHRLQGTGERQQAIGNRPQEEQNR